MTWPFVALEKVATIAGGSTPSRGEPTYWGPGHYWVTPTDLPMPGDGIMDLESSEETITDDGLDSISASVLPVGTVLFSTRATIGKLAIAQVPLVTNQGFNNLISGPEIDNRYLAYALQFFTPDISRLAGSTTFKEVSRSSLRSFKIPLPPLKEQRRIVELLGQADALRRLCREADARAARLLPALFLNTFGDLTTNPKGWPVKSFDETFRDTTAGNEKLQSKQFQESGSVAIVDQGQSQIAGYTDDESLAYKGKLPAIVFGDHTRIFKYIDHPFVLGADGVRVLTEKEAFDPLFAYWHCRMLDVPSAGYSRHFKFLKEKAFICPTDELQDRFSRMAAALMNHLATLEKAAGEVEHLFTSLLQRAFAGVLTSNWRQAHMHELLAEMQRQAITLNLPMPREIAP